MRTFERLEDRLAMASSIGQVGDNVNVLGDNADNTIVVTQQPGLDVIQVSIDGVDRGTFRGVNRVNVVAQGGNDKVYINTDDTGKRIVALVLGGDGDDILQGGGGTNQLDGGNGNDLLTAFVTDDNYNPIGRGAINVLIGGPGNDSLWGGWGVVDVLQGGDGDDVIYDIVGGRNFIDGGNGNDWTINRAGAGLPTDPLNNPGVLTSDTLTADPFDFNVVKFDAGTQANGPVLQNGTLYVLNLGAGNIFIDETIPGQLNVSYNGQQFTYSKSSVRTIAGIGGATQDVFVNNTDITSIFYGQGGNDVLLGGSNRDILKGGADHDHLDGRDGADDLSGDAGADRMIVYDNRAVDTARFDARDLVFGDIGDRLVNRKLTRV